MKIKFIAPIAALAAAGLLTGCNPDRLEIPQKGAVSTETFYKTDEDAEAALVAAYQGFLWNVTSQNGASIYIPYTIAFNMCGDDVNAAGAVYGDNDFAQFDKFFSIFVVSPFAQCRREKFIIVFQRIMFAVKQIFYIVFHDAKTICLSDGGQGSSQSAKE